MTVFPLCAGAASFHATLQNQTDTIIEYYGVDPKDYKNYRILLNPIKVLYNITLKDFTTITNVADSAPDKLLNYNVLDTISSAFVKKDSFIVVKKDGRDYYIGDETCYKNIPALPLFQDIKLETTII